MTVSSEEWEAVHRRLWGQASEIRPNSQLTNSGVRNVDARSKPPVPAGKPRAQRRCSACGDRFRPTAKRRMLCDRCHRSGDAEGLF